MASCLLVNKACKLFGIPVIELDLDACTVVFQHNHTRHRRIGREVQFPASGGKDMNNKTDVPFQGLVVSHQGIGISLRGVKLYRSNFGHVEVTEVKLVSDGSWPAPFPGSAYFPLVMQYGVTAQTAYKIVTLGKNHVHEGLFGERRIGNDVFGHTLQLALVNHKRPATPLIKTQVFCITALVKGGLYGPQHHAVVKVDVDDAYAHNLKLMPYCPGTSGPECSYVGRLLPVLRNIGGVDGYALPSRAFLEGVGRKPKIHLHPVGLPLEGMPVGLLATCSVAFQLKEIYLSGDDHE